MEFFRIGSPLAFFEIWDTLGPEKNLLEMRREKVSLMKMISNVISWYRNYTPG